jgi:hypothetical protein
MVSKGNLLKSHENVLARKKTNLNRFLCPSSVTLQKAQKESILSLFLLFI